MRFVVPVLALSLLLPSLGGCAPARTDTSRLEAAIARFEQAAAQAEAAAAQAEESARKAEAAAQAQERRRCAEAGRGPVRTTAQASRRAQTFLDCLAIAWGAPTAVARVAPTTSGPAQFRVQYGPERAVVVSADSGHADFPESAAGD